ncbi:MAG: tetratricopeptide repeat protein, partial [Chloroflexi bacterium]|nr:tetratricopeptide repeat protein [Chloroflexota bacterium]
VVYINQHDQSDRPASAIEEALATLVAKEMLFWQDSSAFAGAQEYLFKHAILREVTYESVLRSVRRRYHALVADWLIEHSGERAVEMFGLIAEHLELAERTEQAIVYLRWAGQQAAGQFANAEAIHYFSRALTLLPDTDTTRDTRYALLSARERVYDLQGMRPAQARDLAELETLVNALPADDQCIRWQAELALRQANYAQVVGDFSAAIRAAQATIVHAQAAQDTAFEAAGYLQWGLALWRLGDLESCRARLEKALALAQSIGSRDLEAESLRILGNVYYYQGDYGEAAAYWKRSLPISRDIGDRAGEASALSNLGEAARSQGDYPGALTYYERRLRMCREIGDRWGETIAVLNLGLVSHNLGDDEASLAYSELVFQLASEIISPIHQAYALTTQGHALAGLGRLDEAAVAYQRAAAMRRESGEHHLVMEAVAGKARVCLAQGDLAGAQAQVDKILGYLDQEGGTLDGTEEPLRVYLTCYRVLQAQQDPRARAILQTAHRLLQERASRITDEALRRSFLENVPAHREIGREFTAGE